MKYHLTQTTLQYNIQLVLLPEPYERRYIMVHHFTYVTSGSQMHQNQIPGNQFLVLINSSSMVLKEPQHFIRTGLGLIAFQQRLKLLSHKTNVQSNCYW